jgi:imidazolonepropionase-like amidohydrolase
MKRNAIAMPAIPCSRGFFISLSVFIAVLSLETPSAQPVIKAPGHIPTPLGYHVFQGARVIVSPTLSMDDAVLVIAEGKVVSISSNPIIPAGSRVWDMKGHTIYPGFIDPYCLVSRDGSTASPTRTGDHTQADHRATGDWDFFGSPGGKDDPGSQGPGASLTSISPEYKVLDDWHLNSDLRKEWREQGFTAVHLSPSKGIIRGTGAVVLTAEDTPNALVQHTGRFQHIAFDSRASAPDAFPRSLMGVISAIRQTFIDAQDYHRPRKGGTNHTYHPSLESLKLLLQGTQSALIEPGSVLMATRASRIADEFGIRYTLVASGQEWRRPDLIKQIRAPFIVPVNFPELPEMPGESDWDAIDLDLLRAWDWAPENPAMLVSHGRRVALTLHALLDRKQFRKKLRQAISRGLREEDALAALSTIPAALCGLSEVMGTLEPGKQANFTVIKGTSYFVPTDPVESTWIKGKRYPNDAYIASEKHSTIDTSTPDIHQDARRARSPMDDFPEQQGPDTILVKNATVWTCSPSGIMDGADILIQNAHILKVGNNLSLPAGDLGTCLVIDAEGKHITPGLIDAHSHSMIMGGVNEGTLPSSAMVRVADVINSETDNLYYQLAGGLTVANLLHGSANPIGGQNAVIKLRWGQGPEGLLFREAPGGIKFALGENVKQSNSGDDKTTRFPQTRMGVPVFYENRFTAAKQYQEAWKHFHRGDGERPDRDLEMEALTEILEGKRWIHCHSYRQDEILVFLRVMESFGIQVGTLQHVLEGYKIADEIAHHGAGASCFTDWWAYKYEVIDAIPYAGSLMHARGALVSFNSDDSDLARRMHLEAAKAVKYGQTPQEEALNFVTLYPAQQLRIDHLVGSLEEGKQADFVLWSSSPLDSGTTCLETWIEGVKYFDRHLDSNRGKVLSREKANLLAKIKQGTASKKTSEPQNMKSEKEASRWRHFFQRALEKQDEGRIIHCDD